MTFEKWKLRHLGLIRDEEMLGQLGAEPPWRGSLSAKRLQRVGPGAGNAAMLSPMDELVDIEIEPAWIDYNGHMNVAFYVLVFDRAIDEMLDRVGMDAAYRQRTGTTTYTLETHVTYLRELKLGEAVRVSVQIIDVDAKRVHCFLAMHHRQQGFLAATMEQILIHMDARETRASAMASSVREIFDAMLARHRSLPRPEQLGHRIGIRRR